MEYNDKTKLREIQKLPELKPIRKYLLYGGMQMKLLERVPVGVMRNGGWKPEEIFDTVEKLRKRTAEGRFIYPIYKKAEQADDRKKKDCHVAYFPAQAERETAKQRPYIIVCAGGAYCSVCNLLESYPVALKFNELGYHAFVLNYRVGNNGIMPKPMDDLAQAVSFIRKNKGKFGINAEHYIVCGFSAGGNLAGQWGTTAHGYKHYGLPKPDALFLAYPAVNSSLFKQDKNTEKFMVTMFGKNYSKEKRDSYDIDAQADKDFPPSYIVCCRDDDAVPCENSRELKKSLDLLQIDAQLEIAEKGGHGFGTGVGTDAEGWLERALAFYDLLQL